MQTRYLRTGNIKEKIKLLRNGFRKKVRHYQRLIEDKFIQNHQSETGGGGVPVAVSGNLSEKHFNEYLKSSLSVISNKIRPYTATIFLWDPDKNLYEVAEFTTQSSNYKTISIEEGRGLLGWAVKSGVETFMPEYTLEYSRLGYYSYRESIRSFMAVPLRIEERIAGLITLDCNDNSCFTRSDLEFVRAIAGQLESFIAVYDRMELYRKDVTEYAVLNKISSETYSSLDFEEIGNILMDLSKNIVDYDFCGLSLWDENAKNVWARTERGFSDELGEDKDRVEQENKLIEWVVTNAKPLMTGNVKVRLPSLPFDSYFGVPLLSDGKVIGVLSFGSRKADFFKERDKKVVGILSNQVARIISNAKILKKAQNQVKDLSVLYEMGAQMISTIEIEKLLEIILELSSKSLTAEDIFIALGEDDGSKYFKIGAVKGPMAGPLENCVIDGAEGVLGWVMKTGSPVSIADTKLDFRCRKNDFGFSSLIAAPILKINKVIGVVFAGSVMPSAFSDKQFEMMTILCSQASLAVINAMTYEKTRKLAATDELTGLFNQRYMRMRLSSEMKRAKRYNSKLTVVILDVDHFKVFNDKYGHLEGDSVLKEISQIIKNSLRDTDIVARYGGEEFVLIFPHTDSFQGYEVAERVRSNIQARLFLIGEKFPAKITISLGLATYPDCAEDMEEFLGKADKSLYLAKQSGRNCIKCYSA